MIFLLFWGWGFFEKILPIIVLMLDNQIKIKYPLLSFYNYYEFTYFEWIVSRYFNKSNTRC